MATLQDVAELARAEHGLIVVSTLRPDLSIHSSVVTAGVMAHPLTGEQVLAFAGFGRVKLNNLRARPALTATVRSGSQWFAVEGAVQVIGPDDPHPDVDEERLRVLLREVYTGAGGTHDDWDHYDTTMREQRVAAVFVSPARIYGN
jgi:PPOX class probable F420-dependent enzyme